MTFYAGGRLDDDVITFVIPRQIPTGRKEDDVCVGEHFITAFICSTCDGDPTDDDIVLVFVGMPITNYFYPTLPLLMIR